MNFNSEDHYRCINHLEKDSANMRTSAMLLVEARKENEKVTRALKDQEKELQTRRERLRERAENVKKGEENLRQYKLDTAKELQENEARRLRAIQKTKEDEAKIKKKEENIEKLKAQYDDLLAQKEQLDQCKLAKQHQESTAKMFGKSIRKEILEREANEKEAEHKKLELIKDIKEQRTRLLHYTKQLQQQQTELDIICSETHEWELKQEELCSTAEREELQYAQIKIRKHFQLVRGMAEDRNVLTTSRGTEEDDGQQRLRSKL